MANKRRLIWGGLTEGKSFLLKRSAISGVSGRQKGCRATQVLSCSRRARSGGEWEGKQMEKVRPRTARRGPRWSSSPTASSRDNYQESRSPSWCVGVVNAAPARISFVWRASTPVTPRSWFEEWETSSDWSEQRWKHPRWQIKTIFTRVCFHYRDRSRSQRSALMMEAPFFCFL